MDPRLEKFVPEDLRGIIARMEDWAQEQRVLERATEACHTDLRRCVTEQWEGYGRLEGRDLACVTMRFFRSSLTFQGWAPPAVRSEFMLYHTPRGDDGPFGSYRFSVRLDGHSVGGHLIVFTAGHAAV